MVSAHPGGPGGGIDEALYGALDYAACGYVVAPVTIRIDTEGKKRPVFHTHWEKDPDAVSSDPDQLAAWARRWPGCGWHAPCGPNGFVTVDGDRGQGVTRGGMAAVKDGVAEWFRAGGPTSPMTATTRSGGRHWYFAAPQEPIHNSEGKVLPGVDVRGDGGTVFIGGTTVWGPDGEPAGSYDVERVVPVSELPALPDSWARRLRDASGGGKTGETPAASPTLHSADDMHDLEWVRARHADAVRRANTLVAGDFRHGFFSAAVNLYKAADRGIGSRAEADELLREAVWRVWAAEPDANDRTWVAEARHRARVQPWPAPASERSPDRHSDADAGSPAGEAAELAGTGDGSTLGEPDEPEPVERTSWYFTDLSDVLGDDIEQEPPPAVLRRSDGAALLYAGRVNGVLGESESGKSWVAQHAAVQVIADGGDVAYFDMEDSKAGVVGRLRQLGAEPEAIRAHFAYIAPEDHLSLAGGQAWQDWADVVQARPWALLVVDGFNLAMDLLGMDMDNNREAGRFVTTFLRPMARESGAALFYVDHVPKDPSGRNKGGIGAQAKRAYTDGCCMRAEIDTPFGRGQSGRLRLTVDKDRHGHVRGVSEEGKNIGMFKLLSTDAETGAVQAEIESFMGVGPKEPTVVMEKVSIFLQGDPEAWFTTRTIRDGVEGKAATIADALNRLRIRGMVERRTVGKQKVEYQFKKRFTRFIADVDDATRAGEPPDDWEPDDED